MSCKYCGRNGCNEECANEEVTDKLLADKQDLRAVAYEIAEKGYYSFSDLVRFCEANKILIF